jgi:hypothetical protein
MITRTGFDGVLAQRHAATLVLSCGIESKSNHAVRMMDGPNVRYRSIAEGGMLRVPSLNWGVPQITSVTSTDSSMAHWRAKVETARLDIRVPRDLPHPDREKASRLPVRSKKQRFVRSTAS